MDPVLKLIRTAMDNSAGCLISDAQGKYIYVNDNWTELMDMPRENVLGKYVHDIFPATKIDEVIATKKPVITEICPINKKSNAWIGKYTPLFENGILIGVMVSTYFSDTDKIMEFRNKMSILEKKLMLLNDKLKKTSKYSLDTFVGKTKAIIDMKELITQVSRSNSTVLIEGETGTGKEIVAHSVHSMSPRGASNFVKINCAAIPHELFESELFGYEEGSFTGSKKGGMKGKFELANSGSIFLDEINQLSPSLQPKLLRVLQEKEIERVGGKASIPIDVRVISSSNVPLENLVRDGLMRSDLYFRLNVFRIKIPPLRKRKDDIPLITESIIKRLNRDLGSSITGIDQKAINLLCDYHWPGNVRELYNVIERAMNIAWIGQLKRKHFSEDYNNNFTTIFEKETELDLAVNKHQLTNIDVGSSKLQEENIEILNEKLYTKMRDNLLSILRDCGGNKTKAAEKLGISRTALYKQIKKYNIDKK